jgi:group I intron endonuclease
LYCVYIHTNKVNGKKYVGQTGVEANSRWRNGKGYKVDTYFGKAIAKYGWDNFDHEIVAENLTKAEANNMEMSLITELNTNDSCYGYNLTAGGDGTVGVQRSEEYRRKQRESHLGKKRSEEVKKLLSANSARRKGAVLQFSKTGEFIKEWSCMSEAMYALNNYHIPKVCRGERKTAAGFVWKLKDK